MRRTLRDGVPLAFSSSKPLVCPSSAETGDGRPLEGGGLALILLSSSFSGSGPSLLGAGVKEEPELVAVDLDRFFEGAGLEGACREGKAAGAPPVEGVLWKKPKSVFCPPVEGVFFKEGVDAEVAEVFLGMTIIQQPLQGRKGVRPLEEMSRVAQEQEQTRNRQGTEVKL